MLNTEFYDKHQTYSIIVPLDMQLLLFDRSEEYEWQTTLHFSLEVFSQNDRAASGF